MTVEKFIEFIVDLANDELYERLDGNAKYYFQNGGCYELVKVVKRYIPYSKIVINNTNDHCALYYDKKIYDSNGIVRNRFEYKIASKEDIEYIESRFGIPEKENINGVKISDYLIKQLKECNILDLLELEEER